MEPLLVLRPGCETLGALFHGGQRRMSMLLKVSDDGGYCSVCCEVSGRATVSAEYYYSIHVTYTLVYVINTLVRTMFSREKD